MQHVFSLSCYLYYTIHIPMPIPIHVPSCACRLCMDHHGDQQKAASHCLDSNHLKVTHVDNFWKAVERTAAAGRLTPAASDLHNGHAGQAGMQLSHAVIILPRIVTRLHPVYDAPHDHIYQDLVSWDVNFVIQMLQEFMRISSSKTIPSLAEYRILPDKVWCLVSRLTCKPACHGCLPASKPIWDCFRFAFPILLLP